MNRQALLIGISAYPDQPLPNASGDAERAADALARRGFASTLIRDAGAAGIEAALRAFETSLADAEMGLIYLAGHAVERHGAGYFLPADFPFPLTPGSARHYGISLNDMVGALQAAHSGILVVDACRNWAEGVDDQRRLIAGIDELRADEKDWNNILVAYSTSAKDVARDGPPGRGTAFCRAFCDLVLRHDLSVEDCFREIGQHVLEATDRRQGCWTYSSLRQQISFSDLPRFEPLHRHAIPYVDSAASWYAPDAAGTGLFAGVGNKSAWHVDLAGPGKVPIRAEVGLVGAAELEAGLIFVDSDGGLYLLGRNGARAISTGLDQAFGVTASPDRTAFVHYGGESVACFLVAGDELIQVARVDVGFEVYCCAYLAHDRLWAGGAEGKIAEIDLAGVPLRPTPIAHLGRHINVLVPWRAHGTVFCAGQDSLLMELNPDGAIRRELLASRKPRTAAGIRAALSEYANDEVIRDFIFDPDRLRPEVREMLDELIERTCFLSCACAPSLPLLAVGTDESTLIVFDARDGQLIQEIEVSTGLPGHVDGLAFLGDSQLVVVAPAGQVLFLAAPSVLRSPEKLAPTFSTGCPPPAPRLSEPRVPAASCGSFASGCDNRRAHGS